MPSTFVVFPFVSSIFLPGLQIVKKLYIESVRSFDRVTRIFQSRYTHSERFWCNRNGGHTG